MYCEVCSINNDLLMEVYDDFDTEDGTLFIGIFEGNGNGGMCEQSVWLDKSQVFKLYKHLENIIAKDK